MRENIDDLENFDEYEDETFYEPEEFIDYQDDDESFQNKMRLKGITKGLKQQPMRMGGWQDEKPYSPIKPSDMPLEKYIKMKKSKEMKESIINRIVSKVLRENAEVANYMFFSNLQQIKRQCELLMDLDPEMVDKILNSGHDWADDHVTEAKTNMDQVFDFMMNEVRKEKEYVEFEDLQEGKKKSGTKLCARGKAAAKAKFKVYPSAYSNGYGVQVCKGKMPGTDGKKRCSSPYC